MRLASSLCLVQALSYEDEYAHASAVPNLPYTVDSNRASDGLSSVSPLTSTAPSFPMHLGATSDVGLRAEHFAAKKQSEQQQGVAAAFDGEYVSEQRATSVDSSSVAPSTAFAVNASLRWNPTAFAVERGENYSVSVPGDQAWVDGFVKVDAAGYPAHYDAMSQCWVAAGRCRPYLASRTRLRTARWFELVCGIGDFAWLLQEVAGATARYMPLREAAVSQTLFAVGLHATFTANHTGELVCFANDADHLYWNNQGTIHVVVERTSWPPIPRTDYRLLLT